MTNATHQIAAERQRERIPPAMLLDFEELTNEELAWASTNAGDRKYRAYAGWELEFREAFGTEVYIDKESGETKRRKVGAR